MIIYGTGDVFNRYKEYINWQEVSHVIDSLEEKKGQNCNGFKIELPSDIDWNNSERVVVFSSIYFYEIFEKLVSEFFCKEDRIFSYAALVENRWFWSGELRALFTDISQRYKLKTSYKCLLDRMFLDYESINSCMNGEVAWVHWNEDVDFLDKDCQICRIWVVSHSFRMSSFFDKCYRKFDNYKNKKMYVFLQEIVYIFDVQKEYNVDICIYNVCHKRYNCISDETRKTIAVGKTFNYDYVYTDSNGVNIADLNGYLNECTAIYWIWKNKKHDYVGLEHYRRYFYKNMIKQRGNVIDKDDVISVFKVGYDLIVPEMTIMDISMMENIEISVGKTVAMTGFNAVKKAIETFVPDYMSCFMEVLYGNNMFRCNMFIMPYKLFDSYCKWLFSFIIEAVNLVDYKNMTIQEKRVIGFFAEIMLTVWIKYNNLKPKEICISDI